MSPRPAFYASLKAHQIRCRGTDGYAFRVTLLASENEYLTYPVNGVIRICEQGVDLSINSAVFHIEQKDGSLGAPVSVRKPVFAYGYSK